MERTTRPLVWHGAADCLREHLAESIATKHRLLDLCETAILEAAGVLTDTLRSGGKILLCGNGGSAADCQHIAGELVSRLTRDFSRPGLAAIALTVDTSVITGYANDYNFEGVFERQTQALGRPSDALIAFSTSGNSGNILRAARYARAHEINVVAMTGGDGGQLRELADVAICVPSDCVQHIQEAHITVGHIICAIVERCLFPPDNA